MTSSAVTSKRRDHAARRRTGRIPTNCSVSISGTSAVSHRRAITDEDDSRRLTRSKTAIVGGFSTLGRPVADRTLWNVPAYCSETLNQCPPPLQPSTVDPDVSCHSSSRTSSTADRLSTVSPSDILRLADDKLYRHRAVAAAAARRRFVLLTVGKTTRQTRWKNQPSSSISVAESKGDPESSPSSSRRVPEGPCLVRYTTSFDLASPLDCDTRLAQQTFSVA